MGGRGYGGGGRGRLNTYRYTVTTRMIPSLRRVAMRAILMFHNCEGQSHKTMSTDHNFFEEKGKPKRIRTEVPPLSSLKPYITARPNRLTHGHGLIHGPIYIDVHGSIHDICRSMAGSQSPCSHV